MRQIRAFGKGANDLLKRLLMETQLTESLQKVAIVDPNNQLNMEDLSFISNSKYNKMKIMIRNFLSMLFSLYLSFSWLWEIDFNKLEIIMLKSFLYLTYSTTARIFDT